jgi:hypothetical protein
MDGMAEYGRATMDSSQVRVCNLCGPDGNTQGDASPGEAAAPAPFDALIAQLEQQMPDLQMRHGDVFALANAWAERHDAILAVTPQGERAGVEARLRRIGIRWGMVPGARVTTEFRALGAVDAAPAFLRRR